MDLLVSDLSIAVSRALCLSLKAAACERKRERERERMRGLGVLRFFSRGLRKRARERENREGISVEVHNRFFRFLPCSVLSLRFFSSSVVPPAQRQSTKSSLRAHSLARSLCRCVKTRRKDALVFSLCRRRRRHRLPTAPALSPFVRPSLPLSSSFSANGLHLWYLRCLHDALACRWETLKVSREAESGPGVSFLLRPPNTDRNETSIELFLSPL